MGRFVDGIVDDGGEGIDMCYVFCNGILVKDEKFPVNSESKVRIKFFQVKEEDSTQYILSTTISVHYIN